MLDIDAVVDDFWRSRQGGVYFPPFWFGNLTQDDGYRVQIGLLSRLVEAGDQHIGWKVGLTSQAMQEQYRVHEPLFGYLLEAGRHSSGASFDHAQLIEPGVEHEICFTVGTDLLGPGVGEEDARRAIASVRPAIELAETRGPFAEQLSVAIAENIQQRAVILGAAVPFSPDLDLAGVRVDVTINDERVASATGSAVLGDPIRSVVFLANKLADYGLHLRAGDVVMAGSLTRQFPVGRGDRVVAAFDSIGSVEVSFR